MWYKETIIEIPRENDPVFYATLGDGVFSMRLQWLEEAQYWAFSIYDSNMLEIITARPVVSNSPLIYPIKHKDLPDGDLFIISQNGDPVTYDDVMHGHVSLVYIEG